MGKITGKKQQMNYKPIIYGALIALPLLILLNIYLRSQKPIETTFETGPEFTAHLTASQMFLIRWTTNVPARSTVHYRFDPGNPYQTITTDLDHRGAVAIPANPNQTIEFYIKAVPRKGRSSTSKTYQVKILPPSAVTTASADAKIPE